MAASPRMRESPAYRLFYEALEPLTHGYEFLWPDEDEVPRNNFEKVMLVFAHWRQKAERK